MVVESKNTEGKKNSNFKIFKYEKLSNR